jgi:hypothetical protein
VRAAIPAATRANVSIYGVDPRGLVGVGDELADVGTAAESDVNLGGMCQDEVQLS